MPSSKNTASAWDIHRTLAERCSLSATFALALVLETEGSTPAKAGAKAMIEEDGSIHGTIGGGLVEAEAQRLARHAIQAKCPVVFDFALEGESVPAGQPICGGRMRVLIDPIANQQSATWVQAASALARHERGLLLTTLEKADHSVVSVRFLSEAEISRESAFPGSEAIRSVMKRESPCLFVSQSSPKQQRLEVLVEPVVPPPLLLIVGGGHVGQAVARQASLVGFEIAVIDDRIEFTARELFPEGTTTRCGAIGEEIAAFPFTADAYVVIVTRGHSTDVEALAACLARPVAYLGMIGSRRKVAMIRQEFIASGRAAAEQLDRLHAPIGLEIGAVTVPEIAASIVAELIAARRGKKADYVSYTEDSVA